MVIGVHVAVFDGGSFEKFVKGRFKRLFRGKYFDDGGRAGHPDEEGITTKLNAQVSRISAAEQDTLMKKGLRPIMRLVVALMTAEQDTLMKKGLRPFAPAESFSAWSRAGHPDEEGITTEQQVRRPP